MRTLITRAFERFARFEAASAVLLLAAALLAFAWANSPFADAYTALWAFRPFPFLDGVGMNKSLVLWVNDLLMAVFFFVVGLEIKRELVGGELSTLRKAMLPLVAAVGGMVVPALIYTAFNAGGPGAAGWGIPMATDIAFALGILALLGSRVPVGLKIFLTAVAIVDDMGAVIVIALFYTSQVSVVALGVAVVALGGLYALNRAGVVRVPLYLLLGAVLWVAVLKSGVHATVAGVLLAFTIPARGEGAPLLRLEHALHPWVAFGVMPIFALANAGVMLGGGAGILNPVTLGVVCGLVAGKAVGVLGAALVALRVGWSDLPAGVTRGHLVGASLLCGVGFTMSLFIATLAFGPSALLDSAKVGILIASALAGVLGYVVLRRLPATPVETAEA